MIHLGVKLFNRSSGGGVIANEEFVNALPAIPECRFTTFRCHSEIPLAADVLICMGTEVVKNRRIPAVLWPLTIAPLDRDAVRLGGTSLSSALRYNLLKAKLWLALRKADGLVFGSSYSRDLHLQCFPWIRGKPTLTMQPGIVPPETLRTGIQSTPVPGRIVMVSHLYPYKMIVQAIQAFHIVQQSVPHAELLIVGRETDTAYGNQIRAAVGANSKIQLIGNVPQSGLAKLYTSADVVLFNSICENAGSMSAFDAIWLGCPMVCSNKSSMPEAMQEGVEYANPWQPEETAEALKRVLSSPSYRSELKMKALARAESLLRWDVRAATVVDFCRTITSRKKASPANLQVPKAHAQ